MFAMFFHRLTLCVILKNHMKTIFLFLSIITFSFAQKEDEKYLNYLVAARNNSTFQFNLVINFKNLITNETREICIEGEQLIFALCDENNIKFEDSDFYEKIDKLISENKSRHFEFRNLKAIDRLIGEIYSIEELEKLKSEVNFDRLAEHLKKHKDWKESLRSEKLIAMYAHELFNRGVLTGQNGCLGGITLMVIDRNNPY